jgi:phosphopantothenoylcysteine decarboxylase / phosphopantothenate---cysteine ligase
MHFLISAGPTVEDIDPVRFISNRASGKLGVELARAALKAGNDVTLVHGPLSDTVMKDLAKLKGAQREEVRSAAQMHAALMKRLPDADVIVMNAAVADYTPVHPAKEKQKKSAVPATLKLKPTVDILKQIGRKRREDQVLVGFALETGSGKTEAQRAQSRIAEAKRKLKEKKADVIVLDTPAAMGADAAHFTLVDCEQTHDAGEMSKRKFAELLVALLTPCGGCQGCDEGHCH